MRGALCWLSPRDEAGAEEGGLLLLPDGRGTPHGTKISGGFLESFLREFLPFPPPPPLPLRSCPRPLRLEELLLEPLLPEERLSEGLLVW